MIDVLLRDFDAENNETDRRIYYEVIGKEIGKDKPDDRDSSDEEWGLLGAPDPQYHAFAYRADQQEDQVVLMTGESKSGGDGKPPYTIN